jgi:hypothetical protein
MTPAEVRAVLGVGQVAGPIKGVCVRLLVRRFWRVGRVARLGRRLAHVPVSRPGRGRGGLSGRGLRVSPRARPCALGGAVEPVNPPGSAVPHLPYSGVAFGGSDRDRFCAE